MFKLATTDDLQRLVDDEIQESLTLDYKASPALSNNNKSRDELCKDVSAFANSAGGQIIYGIEEKDRKPIKIDQGSDLKREWLEQVIDSNIQPRVEGLLITPIPVGGGRHAYVLAIPQAATSAPHQAPDKKYYKRQNFQSVPMEDYEIRDTLRRAVTPELHVELSFALGPVAFVDFPLSKNDRANIPTVGEPDPISRPITILVSVTNRSCQPAFHAIVSVGIDAELPLRTSNDFSPMGQTGDSLSQSGNLRKQYWLAHRFCSPPGFPIFKELVPSMGGDQLSFTVAYPASLTNTDQIFYLATSVQTPGYSNAEKWIIRFYAKNMQLEMCRG